MFNIDRTAKYLLASIAVLLAILVFKPLLKVTPSAQAQTTTSTSADAIDQIVGYRTAMISQIVLSATDKVRFVYVMDKAQSFILQYDTHCDVYRITGVTVAQAQAAQTKIQQTNAANSNLLSN
jgi:hypothetical protein